MQRLILLLLCACGIAAAQGGRQYVVSRTASLSSAAAVVTVQQPASGAASVVHFVGAYVYCSAACDVTLERNGTAATATATTPVSVNSSVPAAKSTAFYSSDVGTGSTIGTYSLPASGSQVLDLSAVYLYGSGTSKNVTVRTSAITGTVKIVIQFSEEQ